MACETARETANETANEAGNETANETGNETANETANETGNEMANETGNETASEAQRDRRTAQVRGCLVSRCGVGHRRHPSHLFVLAHAAVSWAVRERRRSWRRLDLQWASDSVSNGIVQSVCAYTHLISPSSLRTPALLSRTRRSSPQHLPDNTLQRVDHASDAMGLVLPPGGRGHRRRYAAAVLLAVAYIACVSVLALGHGENAALEKR